MKTSPTLCRATLLAGILALTGYTGAMAQDAPIDPAPPSADSTPSPAKHGHHGGGPLTADEWAQLKKDREAVFAANPDFKTQEKNLRDQEKALHDQIDAAIVKQDPSAAPLIEKLKAGRHHHGPPPGDANAGGGEPAPGEGGDAGGNQ
jgi:Spy/CpxP family protein refolding chaperone